MNPLAKFLAWQPIANAIIQTAQCTPYYHLRDYMDRWWLFNKDDVDKKPKYAWVPFRLRVHHIKREDYGRHHHSHPVAFRTFLLKGWYKVVLDDGTTKTLHAGETDYLAHDRYHTVTEVSPGGVWTLFVMYKKRGEWGFQVDGKHMFWKDYLRIFDREY